MYLKATDISLSGFYHENRDLSNTWAIWYTVGMETTTVRIIALAIAAMIWFWSIFAIGFFLTYKAFMWIVWHVDPVYRKHRALTKELKRLQEESALLDEWQARLDAIMRERAHEYE